MVLRSNLTVTFILLTSPQGLSSAVTPAMIEEEVLCKPSVVWPGELPLPPTHPHKWTWSCPLCCSAGLSRCPWQVYWWCGWCHQSRPQRVDTFYTQLSSFYVIHHRDSCDLCGVLPWVWGNLCHKGWGQSRYGRELCRKSVPDRNCSPPGSEFLADRKLWTRWSRNLSVQTQQSNWYKSNTVSTDLFLFWWKPKIEVRCSWYLRRCQTQDQQCHLFTSALRTRNATMEMIPEMSSPKRPSVPLDKQWNTCLDLGKI